MNIASNYYFHDKFYAKIVIRANKIFRKEQLNSSLCSIIIYCSKY